MQQQSENEWIVVKREKKKHRHVNSMNISSISDGRRLAEEEGLLQNYLDSPHFCQSLQLVQEFIKKGKPGKSYNVTCLGLGNFKSYFKPHLQFSFLRLVLLETLRKHKCSYSLHVYDPVFTEKEKAELVSMGATVTEEVPMSSQNIFFLPHCERFLFQRVCELYVDSSKLGENKLAWIIGNSLHEYIVKSRANKEEPPEVFVKLSGKEVGLVDFQEAFNDTYAYQL